jgi:hypothetical protein
LGGWHCSLVVDGLVVDGLIGELCSVCGDTTIGIPEFSQGCSIGEAEVVETARTMRFQESCSR